MRLSVRTKMILLLFGTVVLFVAVTLLLNNTLLKPYYKKMKEQALTKSFSTICKLNFDSDDIYTKIKSVEENDNVQVLIIDYRRRVFFCSSAVNDSLFLPVSESGMKSGEQWFSDWLIQGNTDSESYDKVEIFSTQPRFGTPYNSALSASYLSLYAKSLMNFRGVDLPFYFIINIPLASIEDSVQIFNSFALLVGVAILLLSGIATFFMSNRIVKPIVSISATAKQISGLDFSRKLNIGTNDEISELASSINDLSDQLEHKINELSVANEQLMQELLHKEKIDTMRRDFISDVSHELKTPLAIILGYCEGLQLNVNTNDEDREYYCSIIQDEALRMSRLASSLLNLAELESGEVEPEITEIDLGCIAKDRLDKLAYLLEERGIRSEFSSEGCTLALGDYERIEEVVNNLLTNAKNHTPDNGSIRVAVNETADGVRCEVYNSDSHIPQESLERIWESFYKVDKARTRAYGGSGLGLKIVSTILQSHNAEYGAENTEDGVFFWFTLQKAENTTETI